MTDRAARAGVLIAALLMLTPLVSVWRSPNLAVPGALGDNLSFVWNTWWASMSWPHLPGWRTSLLFAPWGTSLLLHTHTLLPSTLAAVLAPGHPLLGTNVMVAVHLLLNGMCAYALAFRITRSAAASMVGAVAFGWSPYVGAHLAGHYNLIAAWTLPLIVLLWLRLADRGRTRDAVLLGLALGLVPYIDYYYAVYAAAALVLLCSASAVDVSVTPEPLRPWQRVALALCAVLLLIVLILLIVILITGGGTTHIGGVAISAKGIENPAAAAGILLMLALAIAYAPRLRARCDRSAAIALMPGLALVAAVTLLIAAPLLVGGVALWRSGGYVTQTYFWRSAPAGVDLGTLVLGNPAGLLSLGVPNGLYDRLHIDVVERGAWLGPGLIGLCAAAFLFRVHGSRGARVWSVLAVAFGVWALGPRLQAFGHDLHVFLPGVLARYIPLASNARMPGRAIVVVYLALAMLAALGAQALLTTGRRTAFAALALLLLFDFLPRPVEVYRPDHPAVYDALARQAGPGAVCELPMGLRDGFGETGRLDMRVLYYQTIHGRPMTGGFVARLDPRVVLAYRLDPVLGVLLDLSGGRPLAALAALPPATAGESLRAVGVRFVMLNRETASADLVRYVTTGLPLRTIDEDGTRTLYEVSPIVNASVAPPRR